MEEFEKDVIKKSFTGGCNYFVFIGNLHPRKNVGRLLNAFDLFRSQINEEFKLVIIGEKFFKTTEIKVAFKNMKNSGDVIFTGRQSPEKLREILGSAMALTFVPLFEGFGIPNLEAMYCDVPVITSNITSIPEVVGDAAILINPFSIDEIKNAMLAVYKDDKLREDLIEKGRKRGKEFNWDKSAIEFWKSIEKCLDV